MNSFSQKKTQYEEAFQDCLTRIIEDGESPQDVLQEYPFWVGRLREDIGFVQEMMLLRQDLDPRPGFLDESRIAVLQQLEYTLPKTVSKPLYTLEGIRDHFSSYAITIFDSIKSSGTPNRYLQAAQKSLLLVVILVVAFLGFVSIRLAAYNAVPGSGVFPVRVALETIHLWFIVDEEKEAKNHLYYAQVYLVDYTVLVSKGELEAADLALRQYEWHMTRTSRILHVLSETGDEEYGRLNNIFMRTYLQDLELFQVLSQSQGDPNNINTIRKMNDSIKNLSYL